jgi:hypothetical protein
VEKYSRTGQATEENIIRRMRVTCWISKATNIDSEYVILTPFLSNNGYANAPQYYILRTLRALLELCEIIKYVVWAKRKASFGVKCDSCSENCVFGFQELMENLELGKTYLTKS